MPLIPDFLDKLFSAHIILPYSIQPSQYFISLELYILWCYRAPHPLFLCSTLKWKPECAIDVVTAGSREAYGKSWELFWEKVFHLREIMPAPFALLYLFPPSDVGQCHCIFGSQMCMWNPKSSPQYFRQMTRLAYLHLWSTVAMYSSNPVSRWLETGFSLQCDFFFLLLFCFSVKKMYMSFKMFLKHIWVHCKYYCCCNNQKKKSNEIEILPVL